MIYLQPEVRSGLGEDTFWTWFAREFPESSFDLPPGGILNPDDVVLQYSTLGPPRTQGGITVALCWELYPEMRRALGSAEWDGVIERTRECARACTHRVVASAACREFYEDCGPV